MKIILIGLPGSGKTTIGKELAVKLNIPFFDLDKVIESNLGMKIDVIFHKYGESFFRELESNSLKGVLQSQSHCVLATGGGTPCFFDNMELINNAGTSVFLDVPIATIAQRLKRSSVNKRPLFSNLTEKQMEEKIQFLRSQRIPFYEKSHHKILGEEINVSDLIKIVYS